MINLRHRSYEKELMDADDISFPAMAQTLRELNIINTRLGGHAITLSGVRRLVEKEKEVIICEIGCGGGDNLQAINKYCSRHKIKASYIGIDMNAACIAFAKEQYPELPCQWICSDYAKVDFGVQQPDIIFSSLFCHHFTDEELHNMLQWLSLNSGRGFFINDLHRHWLAYYLIKYITRFFSRSYLVRNDACLSVARGFKRKEWKILFDKAGISSHHIVWKWAFRFLVTSKNSSLRQ
jgi:2-polyprenyl-3-methyl-5-hydroxy-6-metoxy-1,4-benzoquinol methylase